jgi:hypothetical protein
MEGSGVGVRYLNSMGENAKSEVYGGQFTNLKVLQAVKDK